PRKPCRALHVRRPPQQGDGTSKIKGPVPLLRRTCGEPTMRYPARRPRRSGATMVESTLLMITFFTMMAALADLGMAVFQANIMPEAAAQAARTAIVHGSTVPRSTASWGPGAAYPGANPYSVTANSTSDPIALAIQPYLAGLDTSKVSIVVNWIDASND